MNVHLFLVQKINQVKKINRGGWTGFGMVTVGIDPNTFEVLNGHPTKIPTDRILGDVVQNAALAPLHYWLRPIKGVHLGFANFASHFIRVQIFQIDFPLILYL